MIWKIFWASYLWTFTLVSLLLWFFLYYKKKRVGSLCTERTVGEVIRYSTPSYSGVHLPVVEYVVNGMAYRVTGPRFKAVVTKYFSSLSGNPNSEVESNLTTRDDLPEVLKVSVKKNSMISMTKSPMMKLFPIGSEATVYYNSDKPKVAYVERFVAPSALIYNLLLLVATVTFAGGIIALIYA